MNHVLDYISYLPTCKSLYQHQIQEAQFYLIVYLVFALVYTYLHIFGMYYLWSEDFYWGRQTVLN